MKLKKMLAAIAAYTMLTGISGNMYAGAECVVDNEDAILYATECYYFQWPDDDGSFSELSGEILSKDKIFSIKPKYGDKTVKMLSSLSGEATEYLVIPKGCEMTSRDTFNGLVSLKGVSLPDSVTSVEKLDQNITIVGAPESYAEFFAKKHGNNFVVSGDVTKDGKVGAADIVCQMLFLTGEEAYEDEIAQLAADTNHDGIINIVDLICLKKNIFGGSKSNFPDDDIIALSVYKSARTKADPEVLKGYLDFTADFSDNVLLKTEDKKEGCNRVYSPLSVYMAASVLTECSGGHSFEELAAFLHVSDTEDLQKANQSIFDSLYYNEFDRFCRMTNSVWLDRQYTFKRDKLETLAEKYYTSSFTRDLKSQNDCDEISEWIYQNTSGKFKPLIMADPNANTILKIINTVTFKEKWSMPFGEPHAGVFRSADGDVECQFMHEKEMNGTIVEDEAFTTYSKYFEDGYRMNFVLPAEEKSVDDVISDPEIMKRVLAGENALNTVVIAEIPKFKSESKFDLIPSFKDAGVKDIFAAMDASPLMDFDENDIPGAYVDEITHEAVIDVNEKGCEAAAYTIIDMVPNCPEPDSQYYFTADRPFIYFISDNEGTPVFVGIVNDPTQK